MKSNNDYNIGNILGLAFVIILLTVISITIATCYSHPAKQFHRIQTFDKVILGNSHLSDDVHSFTTLRSGEENKVIVESWFATAIVDVPKDKPMWYEECYTTRFGRERVWVKIHVRSIEDIKSSVK